MFGVAVSKICRWYNQIQKNNASTNTNFSFRSPVLANNFILQVLWKRTRSVFINIFFLHFSLLTWLNSRSSRKPIKREACIHDISLFFMSQKLEDRKSNRQKVSVWTWAVLDTVRRASWGKNQKRLICIWPRRCWTRSTWPILSNHVIADGGLILAPLCG